MTLYELLLFVHIVAAMVWVGGGILLTILAVRVDRSEDMGFRLRFSRASAVIGPVAGTAAIVVLAMGVAMVVQNDAWSLSQTWIWLALVLFAISAFVGGGYFGRAGKRIDAALEANDVERANLLTRQMRRVSTVDLTVLLVVVWLMVAKPGA